MGDLRYLIPIIKRLEDHDQHIYLEKTNTKYNAISKFEKILENIIDKEIPFIKYYNNEVKDFDIIFTVENFPPIPQNASFKKKVCIQHGLDYFVFNLKDNKDSTEYILHDSIYKVPFKQHIPKVPITFWDIKSFNKKQSSQKVFIFYPEMGHHDLVENIVQYLNEIGCQVIIKQRRKWQAIPSLNAKILYDDNWYPSESIVEPYNCHLAIGFSTTSYVDLIPVGVPFVDNCIKQTEFDYIKPESDLLHSHHDSFLENTKQSIDFFLKKDFNRNIMTEKEIKNFLNKIVDA